MATTEDKRELGGDDEWRARALRGGARAAGRALLARSPGSRTSRSTRRSTVEVDYDRDLGYPGDYPFTRGVYPSMYRGRLWTMRQFAGFGTAEETNERFRYLLEHGQTGLSTAFDMPTLMGYDSDHARSLGEVGREGVAVDSLDDMETLFDGIPLGEVSTSMTINSPAAMLLAFYVVRRREAGRRRATSCAGRSRRTSSRSTSRRRSASSRREPSMRLVTDMVEFCAREMPLWHPISISGYHIREAGSTAAQELAFTLADGFAYVECGDRARPRRRRVRAAALVLLQRAPRLLRGDREVPRRAPDLGARAARRYGAKNPRSWLMRFHTQTAGVSLTAQQPEVNIVRTAIEALAAVLGGTQSLHTNSFDEALALPTEDAVRIALRTQQVIAHETGVVNTIDPLGGSYYVEQLTNELERRGLRLLRPDREARRRGRRRSRRTSSSARSPRRRSATRPRSRRSSGSSSASTATSSRRRPRSSCCASTRRSSRSRSSASRASARGATRRRSSARSPR